MTLDALAPDLRDAAARLSRSPDVTTRLGRVFGRYGVALLGRGDSSGVTRRTVPVTKDVSARLTLPTTRRSDAALLWIHGGGFVTGHPTMNDRFLARVARELGIPVIAPDYRLSPDHWYPTPLEDCDATWQRIATHASDLGINPERVIVGGQSAGGGLAAQLCLRLRDAGGVQPLAQWLFAPMLDDRTTADTSLDAVEHIGWTNAQNRVGWRHYLCIEPGRTLAPTGAVPSRVDDLTGLPPTWIGVGDIDLFASEDRAYADRLGLAGVDVTYHEVPGGAHGFETWAPEAATTIAFQDAALAWLADQIGR